MFLYLSQKQNSLCRNINHFFRGNFLWLFYQLVIRIHSQQRILFLCLYRTNSFYSRLAIFVLMHCIHSETFQFWCKFFQNPIRQSSPFQHGFVEHGSEFITSHWTIPFEFSIGVTSEHTIAFQSRYIFISPVILRYIWEELELRRIQFLSCIHIQQSRFQTFQFFSEVFDFLRHSYLGSRNMVALAQFQADTCIHHIFTITEAAAYREHGIFIRTIVSADSGCIFAIVIAIACCDIPLVIRIEVQRVERCQSCCACANLIHTVAQLVDAVAVADDLVFNAINAIVNRGFAFLQLTIVYCIAIFFTVCYVGNLITICIQTFIADIGIFANFYASIADRCLTGSYSVFSYANLIANLQTIFGYAHLFTNLQAIFVHYSLTGGYAVCIYSINFDVFLQLYLIVCSFTFFSSIGNSNIAAAFYFSVFSCGCCYVGKFLIQFADCGSSAIAICNFTFFYLAVLQIANFVVQVVYSVNHGSLTVLVLNIAGNIINIAYIACFCYVGNGNGTCIFAILVDKLHINLIVCTNAVFTRFDMGIGVACFNSFFQLANIDSICIFTASCYIRNLTTCYTQSTANNRTVLAYHNGSCHIVITNDTHSHAGIGNREGFVFSFRNNDASIIQINLSISVRNRFNAFQVFIQTYFICLLTILISFFYGNVTAVYYFRMLRRFCSCAICLIFDQFKLFFRCRSASRSKILTV